MTKQENVVYEIERAIERQLGDNPRSLPQDQILASLYIAAAICDLADSIEQGSLRIEEALKQMEG